MTAYAVRPLHPVPERPRTSWTAAELLAMQFPDPVWAVPGLIAEGVNLLAGPPKVGKSWLSLGLGLAIAAGGQALGRIDVEPGPVLYLALEDTPRRLQARMRKVLAGRPAPDDLTLDVFCPPMAAGGEEYVAEWLEAHPGARLVVIDVFAKVRGHAPAGMSAYDADYAAMGRIKRLADTFGVAVLLVHHVRKAGSEDFLATVSGTNGIAGAADAVLVLERGRNQGSAVLHVTGRDVEETDYPLTFDPSCGAWALADGPADEHLVGDTRAAILRYLRAHPGSTPAQIAGGLGINRDNAKKTCARMADDGQLNRDATGRYYAPLPGDNPDSPRTVPAVPVSPNPF